VIERLLSRLKSHHSIALDTSVFIYHLEGNPRYGALADAVFAWMERPGHEAVASTVTMTELLVAPYRNGEQQKVDAIYALLVTYPHLAWLAPDLEISDLAAQLRAQHGLKTSDALLAATALRQGVTLFVTNDWVFRRIDSLASIVLDELL